MPRIISSAQAHQEAVCASSSPSPTAACLPRARALPDLPASPAQVPGARALPLPGGGAQGAPPPSPSSPSAKAAAPPQPPQEARQEVPGAQDPRPAAKAARVAQPQQVTSLREASKSKKMFIPCLHILRTYLPKRAPQIGYPQVATGCPRTPARSAYECRGIDVHRCWSPGIKKHSVLSCVGNAGLDLSFFICFAIVY